MRLGVGSEVGYSASRGSERVMKVKNKDLERMVEIINYSIQDARDNGDDESVKWMTKASDLLDNLLIEGILN